MRNLLSFAEAIQGFAKELVRYKAYPWMEGSLMDYSIHLIAIFLPNYVYHLWMAMISIDGDTIYR